MTAIILQPDSFGERSREGLGAELYHLFRFSNVQAARLQKHVHSAALAIQSHFTDPSFPLRWEAIFTSSGCTWTRRDSFSFYHISPRFESFDRTRSSPTTPLPHLGAPCTSLPSQPPPRQLAEDADLLESRWTEASKIQAGSSTSNRSSSPSAMDSAPSAGGGLCRRRSAGDSPMPGAEAPFSTSTEPKRVDRASTYPPGPSRLRDATVYPRTSPVGAPIPLRRPSATPSSIAYSTWDARLSPIDPVDTGAAPESIQGTPTDSLSPVATGSIPSSAASPRDLSDEAPIRIRRVGALGISVGSDSDDGDVSADQSSVEPTTRKRWSGGNVVAHRGSINSELDDEDDEESTDGARNKSRKRVQRVAEVQYRSIVDDLTLESKSDFGSLLRLTSGPKLIFS